jgi:hypothetical protein
MNKFRLFCNLHGRCSVDKRAPLRDVGWVVESSCRSRMQLGHRLVDGAVMACAGGEEVGASGKGGRGGVERAGAVDLLAGSPRTAYPWRPTHSAGSSGGRAFPSAQASLWPVRAESPWLRLGARARVAPPGLGPVRLLAALPAASRHMPRAWRPSRTSSLSCSRHCPACRPGAPLCQPPQVAAGHRHRRTCLLLPAQVLESGGGSSPLPPCSQDIRSVPRTEAGQRGIGHSAPARGEPTCWQRRGQGVQKEGCKVQPPASKEAPAKRRHSQAATVISLKSLEARTMCWHTHALSNPREPPPYVWTRPHGLNPHASPLRTSLKLPFCP